MDLDGHRPGDQAAGWPTSSATARWTPAKAFLADLRSRLALKEPVHLTSDQYSVYWEAVDDVFGEEGEHHLLKKYEGEQGRRYDGPRRAAQPDHANGDATIHAAHQCL